MLTATASSPSRSSTELRSTERARRSAGPSQLTGGEPLACRRAGRRQPHLIDTEVLHALRRLTITGEISEDRAADARNDFAELALIRYPHQPLSDRVWELRHNLTAYDATFGALAEALGVPLVTCDARLASAPGYRAHVELFEQ